MKIKVAVILSGCGYQDGSEINESVLTLLALAKSGADVQCVAPSITQRHVVDHRTGEPTEDEDRNVLIESSRIARGEICSLDDVRATDFDAFIYVGGFGAAKNLSSFAFDGPDYDIDPGVNDLIQTAHAKGIPQGFMCIAPVLAACALGKQAVLLTIGNDSSIAEALQVKGANHQDCPVDNIIVDQGNRVVSTPAYLLAQSITEAEAGINRLVAAILQLVTQK
ncbi:MAG: isoprenoid biosynthesis glyoxalase ElbB [Verrucomicrobia bacterium]|jgi:enhancing lycopene biosynthesis protein 2|nr:isoprenoid biosynthesis glyoxalase ElbB [Verrucomicrobiota bacterium]